MKKDLGIIILLVVLCGVAAMLNPRFLSEYNLQNTARQIGMFGIFSLGLGIVIITGGIDLSVGSVLALLGVLLAVMLRGGALVLVPDTKWFHVPPLRVPEMSWPLALGIAMLIVVLLGLIHAFLIVKMRLQPFIVTLCGLLLYRGVARFMANDETKGFGDSDYGVLRTIATKNLTVPLPFTIPLPVILAVAVLGIWFVIPGLIYGRYFFFFGGSSELPSRVGPKQIIQIVVSAILSLVLSFPTAIILRARFPDGITGPLDIPMPFVILVIAAVIIGIIIHKSVYGRYLFAVGRNEDAARYSGINSKLMIGSAYVLCMLLTGIAGIIISLDTNSISASDFGNSYELYGIAAAVLGGCSLRGGEGSILGVVVGTALLQVLQNIVNLLGIPSSLNAAVMGAVILVGVLVDQIVAQRKRRRVVQPAATVVAPVPALPVSTI